ncbi:MAG: nicotinate-nucleotide adenylyltransferase [Deltaproteobacteria bacterium]|nr:nicotinate-nucleotide adenylyltransferase [Deltaproteobacteria bacterium]
MTDQLSDERSFYDLGVIHGRFQILHNDHLKYLLAGKALCEHLVVGITNPDPMLTREDETDRIRSTGLANPLSYFERYVLVRDVLLEAGLTCREFSVVPFPINLPELYFHYVPRQAVFFLSIYDDWGRKKREAFRALGLKTHVLREVPPERKGISAADIRTAIIRDEPWEHLVPPSVAKKIKEWEIVRRLKQ